jgi:hypothetical protein
MEQALPKRPRHTQILLSRKEYEALRLFLNRPENADLRAYYGTLEPLPPPAPPPKEPIDWTWTTDMYGPKTDK